MVIGTHTVVVVYKGYTVMANIVSSTGSNITYKTDLQAYLWETFQTELTEVARFTWNVGSTFLWAGILAWRERGKWAQHSQLSPSWAQMECGQLPPAPAPGPSGHNGLYTPTVSQVQPLLTLLLSDILSQSQESNKYSPPPPIISFLGSPLCILFPRSSK